MSTEDELSADVGEKIRSYASAFGSEQRSDIIKGIKLARQLTVDQTAEYLRVVNRATTGNSPRAPVPNPLGLNPADQERLVFATTFLVVPMLKEEAVSDEVHLSGIVEGIPELKDEIPTIRKLLQAIRKISGSLRKNTDAMMLADRTLPSLKLVEMDVDIRLQFDSEGDVELAAPTVVCVFATDVDQIRLWCQISKSELTALRETADQALAQLAKAELYIAQREGKP